MAKKNKREEELTPWERISNEQKSQKKKHRNHRKRDSRKSKLKDFQVTNLKRMSPLLVIFTLGLLICLFFVTPYSRVSKVTITGNEMVSTATINKFTSVRKNEPLINVWGHQHKLATELKNKSQRLDSVKISTRNFNEVLIKVKEYPTIGYLYIDRGYQPILKSGVIIKNKILNPTANYPIVKKFKDPKILKNCLAQYKKIEPDVRANIVTVSYSPTKLNKNRVVLKMHDKNVVLGTINTFGDKMNYYPSMVSKLKSKSVIDMQVGAYSYPMKSKKASASGTVSTKKQPQTTKQKQNTRSTTGR